MLLEMIKRKEGLSVVKINNFFLFSYFFGFFGNYLFIKRIFFELIFFFNFEKKINSNLK